MKYWRMRAVIAIATECYDVSSSLEVGTSHRSVGVRDTTTITIDRHPNVETPPLHRCEMGTIFPFSY